MVNKIPQISYVYQRAHVHDGTHSHVTLHCDFVHDYDGNLILRILSIVVILLCSCAGIFFPLITTKTKWLKLSQPIDYFIKFFGTGIIIGTAFIHLLQPAFLELGASPCLVGVWKVYNFAPVFAMVGFLSVFLLNIFSLRYIYMKYVKKTIQEPSANDTDNSLSNNDCNPSKIQKRLSNMMSEVEKQELIKKYIIKKNILTFFILELGVLFHSVIIGLTLAVTANDQFVTLFIVIACHQTFEGLGLGARLLDIANFNNEFFNWLFAFLYGMITPASIAIGLLVKSTYNPRSSTTIIVSGTFDSLSAGILIYSGLIELLAEDYIVNSEIRNGNFAKLLYTIFCVTLGFVAMAIIGMWI